MQSLFARPITHRGLHDAAGGRVENTFGAFQASIEKNFAIECDVRLSADNQIIVFHDQSLERLTDGTGFVHQHTLADLKALKLKNCNERIQTLGELLQQVNGSVPLFIELKSRFSKDLGLALKVAEELSNYSGAVATMSFDPHLVAAMQKWVPWVTNGIVAEYFVNDGKKPDMSWFRRLVLSNFLHWPQTKPDFVSFNIRDFPSRPIAFIQRFKKVPVICWTVKSSEQAKKAYKYC
ncbi:MAG: glycerophosphodiester phosphodiesterase, partial [Rhizobiales bacterium]|nr:glycerophosphodiester phosphodiesterase [Hyphomicrobiales bacterium]